MKSCSGNILSIFSAFISNKCQSFFLIVHFIHVQCFNWYFCCPSIITKRSCSYWLVKFHWIFSLIAYRGWSNVITGIWPGLKKSVAFAISIMEGFITMRGLNDSLHIGNDDDKSAYIVDLSVWVEWKAVQETFCAFSVHSCRTNFSHSLSSSISIPYAFDVSIGVFVVSVILFRGEGKRQVNQCNNLVISVTFYYLKIQLLFFHQHLFVWLSGESMQQFHETIT